MQKAGRDQTRLLKVYTSRVQLCIDLQRKISTDYINPLHHLLPAEKVQGYNNFRYTKQRIVDTHIK